MLLAVFGLSIASLYSRFDDYHLTGYCFELWSIYLFLRCDEEMTLPAVALLGVLAGLDIANRINDGAALFVAAGLILPFFAARRRLISLAIFCSSALLTLLGVVALTGDSVRDWATNSIVHAAAIKGGQRNVLAAPIGYPLHILNAIAHDKGLQHNIAYVALVILVCVLMQQFGRRSDGGWAAWRIALGVAAIALMSYRLRGSLPYGVPLDAITFLAVPFAYLFLLVLAVQWVRMLLKPSARIWPARRLLPLIPLLQIPGSALSSRGGPSVLEAYPQAAFLLLLLPVCYPEWVRGKLRETICLSLAGIIAVSAAIAKTRHPYHWHHFVDHALFQDREWYRHPLYGPMYIERGQLRLMQAMCAEIGHDGPPTDLLSITNPYPNYFCNVAPWHGYVQTWYDTASRQTIDALVGELQTEPPKWIVYQRALDSMEAHETVFTGGHPLPHRALDRLIMDRIATGQWVVIGRQDFEGADWIVIRTHP